MKTEYLTFDFVVIGGGLSGICAAVTAARRGVRTALIQDRPVLGGNASKEIRVPPVGATGSNYLYSRETGLVEELQLTNLFENPSASYERWDLILRTLVEDQKHLDCFLDTVVQEAAVDKSTGNLVSVTGYTMGSELYRQFTASLFADCTGDGTVAVTAGAEFRMGKDAKADFGEPMAPERAEPGGMGMSIQMHATDVCRQVAFHKPSWVDLDLVAEDFGPFRNASADFLRDSGGFWWLEWGGDLDTVHETQRAKGQIQKIVYAVWDFLKNKSDIKDEIATFELDWVGAIPGKRESRRIVGDFTLTQTDIDGSRHFDDAIAYGGWGFDDHPGEGFFTQRASYHVAHAEPYNIPLRSLCCRAVPNLLLAGRNISVSHIALSSTRVMMTCAQLGEAIGMTASLCLEESIAPKIASCGASVRSVQIALQRSDHHIHGLQYEDPHNIAPKARVTASSALESPAFEEGTGILPLDGPRLWQFPVVTKSLEAVSVLADVRRDSALLYRLYSGVETGNTMPGELIMENEIHLNSCETEWIDLPIAATIERPGWTYLELASNDAVDIYYGDHPPVGVAGFTVRRHDPIRPNPHSSWGPLLRNDLVRKAYCVRIVPDQPVYGPEQVINPWSRPWSVPHLWISRQTDFEMPEWLRLDWDEPQTVARIDLLFDSSLDFTFFQGWRGYDRNSIPSLVKQYRIYCATGDSGWELFVDVKDNYLRHRVHDLPDVRASSMKIEIVSTRGCPRVHIYSVRVYRSGAR